MSRRRRASSFYVLLAVTIALTLFGIVMVFSASQVAALSAYKDSFYFLKRQAIWAAIGFSLLMLFANIDYRRLRTFSLSFLGISIALLIAALIPGVSTVAGGASRWLTFGPLSVQPSEIAKLALVIFCADLLARRQERLGNLFDLIVPIIPVLGLMALLIILQPDLGTLVIIAVTVFVLLFVAGAKLHHLILLGLSGLSAVILLIFSASYRRERLLSFLNPWKDPMETGFHIIQSLIALGSGKVFGLGLGMSRQKFFYLPAAHTDFIFAIVGEELGLIGTLAVILGFSILIYMGIKIAFHSSSLFGRLLATGITTLIATQAIINMGAVTGLLPITGVPLPLISFGGSSLTLSLMGIGVLLNISSGDRKKSQGVIDARDYFRRRDRRTSVSGRRPRRRAKVS